MNIAVVTTLAVLQGQDGAGRKENQRLKDALERQGASVRCVAWDGPDHEWHKIDALVIRTTWNYHLHVNAFRAFLARRTAQGCQCFNAAALIEWNIDKHYLLDLENAGIPIVPTRYLRHRDAVSALNLPAAWLSQPIVVKPTVSASAHGTLCFDTAHQLFTSDEFAALHGQHDVMVQPFQRHITAGEVSLVAIGGVLTHAVRKVPAVGDFRVQGAYGGKVFAHEPSEAEHALVCDVMAALPEVPAYARIDIVNDNNGRIALMELELIEPQLFLAMCEDSADRLARYIMNA